MTDSLHDFNMCTDDYFKMLFFFNKDVSLVTNKIPCETLSEKLFNIFGISQNFSFGGRYLGNTFQDKFFCEMVNRFDKMIIINIQKKLLK